MGPEPLIVPFALLGLLAVSGSLVGAVFTKNAVVRWLLCLTVLGAVALSAYEYQSTKTVVQNITLSLMALGLVGFVGLFVVAMLSLVLLPFKPFLVRLATRLRSGSQGRR
jgi:uncharacterized membrane protein YeiB